MTTHILYLCTGNSCRSQMAEGWTRHWGSEQFSAVSAGIEAHGKNPRAIAVMKEKGVDISAQESTIVNDEMLQRADVVVTVCGHADEQVEKYDSISQDETSVWHPKEQLMRVPIQQVTLTRRQLEVRCKA